jgi:hypothetical protein
MDLFDSPESFYGEQDANFGIDDPLSNILKYSFRNRRTIPNSVSVVTSEVPNTPYGNLLRTYGGGIPQSTSPEDLYNLDPTSEEYSGLMNLARKDSGARGVLENYYSSMPSHEQFKPRLIDKIGGFLAGTFGGGARATEAFLDDPYNEAVEEWKMQGPGATQRARNLEASKNDEIKAATLGIKSSQAGRIAAMRNSNSQNIQAGALANRDLNSQQGQQRIDETAERNANELEIQRARLRESKERAEAIAEERAARREERKVTAEERANKKHIASPNEIDKAAQLASKDVFNNPRFKSFLKPRKDPKTGKVSYDIVGSGEVSAVQAKSMLEEFKKFRMNKYLKGEY